jgi:hypothetical protein
MNWVSEIDTFFVVLKFGYITITQDVFTNQTLIYIVEISKVYINIIKKHTKFQSI